MKTIRSSYRAAALIAILLLGLALRLAPWGYNRFLEDEALYAYWGLQIATGADPMLDYEPVDKPPLHAYTLALAFILLGQNETAARLPSLFASIASITLLYALARRLPSPLGGRAQSTPTAGSGRALLAALLLALSPFDILFASTAFTDPLLTAWVLGALLAAAAGRLGAAGLLAGLAVATKQQGLLFLPLVIVVWLRLSKSRRLWKSGWLRFAVGFAVVAGVVIGWDLARVQRPGFFEQSLVSYGSLEPAQPQDLGERAFEWLRLVGNFWVSPWFNGLLVGALVGGLVGWWVGWFKMDLALAALIVGFLVLHWLLGFQVWDRYLLGLVPLVALLGARAFMRLSGAIRAPSWRRVYAVGLGLLLVASLAGPVQKAARSELPLGGDHGPYDGIDDLATYVRSQVPPGAVLYHYWLGYHYRFYLYGAPLRLHWYPNLVDLVHDATVYRREPRCIAFPSWQDSTPVQAALADAGMSLVPVFETTRRDGTTSFHLYRLEGP